MDYGRAVGLLGDDVGGKKGGGDSVGDKSYNGRLKTAGRRPAKRGVAAHGSRQ